MGLKTKKLLDFVIQTKQLSKSFNKGKTNEVHPVKEVTISVRNKSCIVLRGSSGSGKTTLLSLLSCLSKPSSGEYICLDQKVSHWSEKFLTDFRQKNIGIIFQHFNLIKGLDVFHNIALPLFSQKNSFRTIQDKVRKTAEILQIAHRLSFKVEKLSGGEMQRVAIARALINNPTILFADEPTAHLDSETSKNILDVFESIKSQGTSIVLTTHDVTVENHSLADELWLMKDGQII